MTRSARLAVGVVVAVVLLMVAAVSALVVVTTLLQLRDPSSGTVLDGSSTDVVFRDPVRVQGEVVDVDARPGEGWASMEVSFDDGGGGVEVATVDLGALVDGRPLPTVGDTVELVHGRDDPTFVLRADDPALTPAGQGDADGDGELDDDVAGGTGSGADAEVDAEVDEVTAQEQRAAAEARLRRFVVLAAVSAAGVLLAGGLTVVAVRRAPVEVALQL